MHFDPSRFPIPAGFMIELTEVKVAIEFAVDACQDILVKRGGDSRYIVIGTDRRLSGVICPVPSAISL